jgi:polysaccharide biosynthesis protein PelA
VRVPLLISLAVLAVALWASDADGATDDPRLAGVDHWAFAIGTDVDSGADVERLAPFDLVVVDGELTPKERVADLRAGGSVVLGYLSVGTIERYRSWYRKAKRHRMELWGDWGEWYANVRAKGFRRLIARRVAPKILARGFDGLFLDNVDMIDGHPKQRRAMFRLVRALSRLAHRRGGYLFAQNGAKAIKPIWGALDGWNLEDVTWGYDFERRRYAKRKPRDAAAGLAQLQRLSAAGLLVTATDYVAAADRAALEESVANACAAGALPYGSNVALTRIPVDPFTC